MIQFGLFSRCSLKVTFKFIFCYESPKMWHLNQYFLTTFALQHAPITVFKIPIGTYLIKDICALFSKKNCHILPPKNVFLRKHYFSWKLKGGTGLQGVSSNLNLIVKLYFCKPYFKYTIIPYFFWFCSYHPCLGKWPTKSKKNIKKMLMQDFGREPSG